MPGLGTIVNGLAIVVGGLIGLFLKKGVSQKVQKTLFLALGSAVIVLGLAGALGGIFRVAPDGTLSQQDLILLILSMAIGGLIGEWLRLEERFASLAELLQKKFAGRGDERFSQGLLTAVILFCTGSMSVVGGIEDGLMANPTTLLAKAVLDGTISVVFASAYGAGVLFSAIFVVGYEGLIALSSFALRPLVTDLVVTQMSMVGSTVILLIGMNMMDLKKLNVANFLPATFIPLVWEIIGRICPWF